MSNSPWGRIPRPSLEQLRKQAKELLRQYRANDDTARGRFQALNHSHPPALADAQFVLAREHGFDTWASLKHHLETVWPNRLDFYRSLAADVHRVCTDGDEDAVARLCELFSATFTAEQARGQVLRRLNTESVSQDDALLFVAKLYGFQNWTEFEASVAQPPARQDKARPHGLSSAPPFYRIDWKENWIEPRPPLSARDWDEILEVMRDNRITGLRAAGQMTDALLQRVAESGLVRTLQLEGSRRVTDAGLKHLARIPGLTSLNLTGCQITDQGLAILRELPALNTFQLFHHSGVSDTGLAHLRHCHNLERVELLGSSAGDGVLEALTGKPLLRHFKSGRLVTDTGIAFLHHFPVFKRWQGIKPEYSLMGFDAEPNHLLLRGQITDQGMAGLRGLDGLFALNIDDSNLKITASGLLPLADLPNLGWLGFDATNETMPAIAALPQLRMLMCQDTEAGDTGWAAVSRSRTLEYIWGRRCYGLTGRGFAALSRIPSLRGLSVSCKNVDGAALSALPHFPSLLEFMPMDVPDAGFRHVGACQRLEALWCMYCRETGDDATQHISGLQRLKTYYAGQTRITDRSLQILSRMYSLERLTFWSCASVTNAGIKALSNLPNLQELSLESMPGITREVVTSFPESVKVSFGS